MTTCKLCGQRVPEAALRDHLRVGRCASALLTFRLLKEGWRPLPANSNSLPAWCLGYPKHLTRGRYEGEPREDMGFLPDPVPQLWVPRWLDIIVDLWSGPIALEGEPRQLQRDEVLWTVESSWSAPAKQKIVDAYREDLRAVRDLLRPVIVGPLPQLIVDVEKAEIGKRTHR